MYHANWYFRILLVVCCGYACRKSGAPGRIAAAVYFDRVVFTHLARSASQIWWSSVEAGVFGVDGAVLCALLAIALTAERFWPLWLTALHLLGTTGHVVKMADPSLIRWGYAFILAVWSYPIPALILFGAWHHQRRLGRFNADRSWSIFSARSDWMPASRPTG
jgi:hypothetical protein